MANSTSALPRWIEQHPWMLAALIFLLVALGTLGPSSYFLHYDTPTIDVMAEDLLRACWGDPAATLGPAIFTTIPYLIFGPNPFWQMAILTVLGAVMAAATFRITNQVTGSKRWAMLAALWLISLPTILYYTRMHLGYPLALFVLGIMLYSDKCWVLSGIVFGLAVLSHFNFSIPAAAFLIWATLLAPDKARIRSALKIICGIGLSFIVIETINFLFTGQIFGWTRAVMSDAMRLSGDLTSREGWPIFHLWSMMAFSNGWLNAVLLMLGITYPLLRNPRVPLMDAIFLAGWSVFIFYSIRIATGNTFLTPRMFGAVYPLFVITSVFTSMRFMQRFKERVSQPVQLTKAVSVIGVILISISLVNSALEAAVGSRTAFADIAHVMQRAADEGLPVRYFGNFHVAYYYAALYGVEVSINDRSTDVISSDTQAVLIFEGSVRRSSRALDDVLESSRINPEEYVITNYPHLAGMRPAIIEEYTISPEDLARFEERLAGRDNFARGDIQIWWPRTPSGEFHARKDKQNYVYYYSGSGCIAPRRFTNDTQNFYDVFAVKIGTLWQSIQSGDFTGAIEDMKR
jgi:hypothetical protein